MSEAKQNCAHLVDGHLPEAWMLRAIDGEVSADDQVFIEEHLQSCPVCHAHKERLTNIMDQLFEYRDVLLEPSAGLSSSHEANFIDKLDGLSEGSRCSEQNGLWRLTLLLRKISDTLTPPTWIFGCAVVILFGFILVSRTNVPAVSAHEMLIRSDAFERASLNGINAAIIIQRIRISVGGHEFERTVYRDPGHRRRVHEATDSHEQDLFVDAKLQSTSLDSDELLSPALFLRMGNTSDATEVSAVQKHSGVVELTIPLTGKDLVDARLTLRASDYHAIGAQVRFTDQSTIQVSELSYQVVRLDTLHAGLFDLPKMENSSVMADNAAPNSILTSTDSMVRALLALHKVHAELGEEIRIDDSDQIVAQIDGVVANDARKREITKALYGIPGIELHVQTLAELRSALRPSAYESQGAVVATSAPPLLDKELKQWFPSSANRNEYVGGILSLGQTAFARAAVLNEIANRFTNTKCTGLSRKGQMALFNLLRDEADSLDEDVAHLQEQANAALVVQSEVSNSSSGDGPPNALSEFHTIKTKDWRDQIHVIHSALGRANDDLSILLVGANIRNQSAEDLRVEARQLLSDLRIKLGSFKVE